MPALSQGFGRGGENDMQGNNMGPAQNQEMASGQGFAPEGMDDGNGQGQAPVEPRFRGCSTLPQDINAKKPISKPPANPGLAPDNGQAPWVYAGQEGGNGGPDAHPPDADRRDGLRPILPDSPPRQDHRTSMMGDWHKPMPRPLMGDHLPEMPPMKSIMEIHVV